MAETKVILVADPGTAPWDRKTLKSIDGVRYVQCDGAFDALDELVSDGADAVVCATDLPDMNGYQFCTFIKTSLGLMSLPIGLVQNDESNGASEFWANAAMPDELADAETFKKEEDALAGMVSSLIALSQEMGWDPENASGYFEDDLASKNVLSSYGSLLDDLLTARLVTGVIRMLSVATTSRREFMDSFFRLAEALAPVDAVGIILNSASPWGVLKVSDDVKATKLDTIEASIMEDIVINGELDFSIASNADSKGRKGLENVEVFPLYSSEGFLGALVIGTCDKSGFEPNLLRFYEGLGNDLANIYSLLIAKERIAELEKQASFSASADSLTGLYNLEFLIGFLQQQLLFSFRQRLPVGLAIVDIDGLAKINEEFGTDIGDFVLTSVANRILNITRSSDLVARYSGDEFAVVLPNTDGQGATVLAEKVRATIEEHSFSADGSGAGPKVTVSVGCAMFNLEDLNPETILRDAKVALQKAKDKGPNSICLDDPVKTD